MTLEALAGIAAGGLALWAAYRSIPRAPSRDLERVLKTALATVLRGEVEAEGGSPEEWAEVVAALVPYHPAGRDPEGKLSAPSLDAIPTPALPGERGLVEALIALPDPQSRWRRLLVDSEQTLDALLSDPAILGPDYDPATVIAHDVDWEAVAAWSACVREGLSRRMAHLVLAGIDTDIASELAAQAGLRGLRCSGGDDLLAALQEPLVAASDRLVLVAEGEGICAALLALEASAGLRDRVVAVISIGGAIGATPELDTRFTHDRMDTELNRATPYLAVQVVDPADPMATDWAGQRFPVPAPTSSGRAPIVPIDLGPIPPDWLSQRQPQLARALWIVLAFAL